MKGLIFRKPYNIEFKEITPDNWRIINSLSIKEEQKNFAAPNVAILFAMLKAI